ncbi:hypothetical protein HMPREF0880_01591 [Yokenella regensburgei ATCC 43003]|nr:hypothetical protein HMPREF0880_01591 [Yokenella regensburgei ATCC 43003]
MKTSRYIQNFYCYRPHGDQPDKRPHSQGIHFLFHKKPKNEQSPAFGQKIG